MFDFIKNLHSFSVDGICFRKLNDENFVEVVQGKYKGDINIPSNINYKGKNFTVANIGIEAFQDCRNLTSIIIPNSVINIGDYAFNGCSKLKSVSIPNSVATIGNEAFSGCSSLNTLTIPHSVTNIGWYAFEGCSGLTSLRSHIENPRKVYLISDVFLNIPTSICKLFVPQGSKEAYCKADQWNSFATILEEI